MFETEILYPIPYMAELYEEPNVESENWKIRTFEVTMNDYRAIYDQGILPGKYVSLNKKNVGGFENTCMMSDTPMERFTNQEFVNNACGRVLIAGLGIGMVPAAIAEKDDVESITILEIDQEIIDLVEPLIRKYIPNQDKITIVQADALTYPDTYNGEKYDWAWLDIWPEFPNSEEDFDMFEKLFTKYNQILHKPFCNGWGYEYAAAVGFGIEEINPIETDAFAAYVRAMLDERETMRLLKQAREIRNKINIDGKDIAI